MRTFSRSNNNPFCRSILSRSLVVGNLPLTIAVILPERVETMYFRHNPISRDLALNICDLDGLLRRDFRHTRRASGYPLASSKTVLYAYCTNT